MFYRNLSLLILSFLVPFNLMSNSPEALTQRGEYITAVDSYRRNSCGKLETDKKKPITKPQTWSEYFKGARTEPEVVQRTERELEELLAHASPAQFRGTSMVIDASSVEKMELVCGGQHPHAHLVHYLTTLPDKHGNTYSALKTRNGRKAFCEILTQPAASTQEALKNPIIIKELCNNAPLRNSFEPILLRIKDSEEAFLDFFAPESPENEKLLSSLYFGTLLGFLNKNTYALEIGRRTSDLLNAAIMAQIPLIHFAIQSLVNYQRGNPVREAMARATRHALIKTRDYPSDFIETFKAFSSVKPTGLAVCLTGIHTLGTGYQLYSMYSAYSHARTQNSLTKFIQRKMISVATYINSMRELYLLAKHNSTLLTHMPELAALECLINPSSDHSSSFNQLIDLLKTSTLQGAPSFFSISGRALAAYKLMKELKDSGEFAELMYAAGKLEALWAMARVIKAHENTAHPYTFVELIEKDTPYLRADNFCNPFVPAHQVVANSIEMKADASGRIILTGPNTGGKSTLIKALWINVLLAQSFGVAYAQKMVVTPFYKISSYLNITDNVSEGKSLFKAELERAHTLRNEVVGLQPGQFIFISMDEMFSGTAPEKAQEISREFMQHMAAYNQCIFINATHFSALHSLESEGLTTNYHMNIIPEKNEDGSTRLRCTYQLLKGVSNISNAHQLAQEQGITW